MNQPLFASAARAPRAPVRWLVAGAVMYFLAAKLGMALFSLSPSNITLLWLPSGIGLVMCLRGGAPALPLVLAASFAANFQGMALDSRILHVLHTAIAGGADTLAAWLAARMLSRHLPGGLSRLRELFVFGVYVCLWPTLVSALILSANLLAGGYIGAPDVWPFIGMLLIADSLGILVAAPLIDAWRAQGGLPRMELMRWLLVALLSVAAVYLAFEQVPALIFLPLPLMLYQVYSEREHGVLMTLLLTTCAVVALASGDLGPFDTGDMVQSRFMLIGFLISTALVVLGIVLLYKDVIGEARARLQWEFQAQHDALTGLVNRVAFRPTLQTELDRAQRLRHPFSLAVLDLDHFKAVNDTYGHAVGDMVLTGFAQRLRDSLRAIDVPARIGGEEFAVLFPETPRHEARRGLERLREMLALHPIPAGGDSIALTVSGGIAQFDPEDEPVTIDALMEAADERLYRAKASGRNRIVTD